MCYMDGQGAYVHNIKGTPRKKKKKTTKRKTSPKKLRKILE